MIGLLRSHGGGAVWLGELDYILIREMTIPQRCHWYQSIIIVNFPVVGAAAPTYLGGMSEQRDTEPAAEQEDAKRPPPKPMPKEIGGPAGPEPTRYGDWEVNGRCTDF